MKAPAFILTAGAVLALAVPAAQAANTSNRLYQTRVHTILAEKGTRQASMSAKADARFYQTQVHTILSDRGVVTITKKVAVAPKSQPMPPQSPASSRR